MNEPWLVTLIVALVGSGAWGAYATLRVAKREAPIKKRDADVAAAHTSQQMALALANELQEELVRVRQDVKDEREARQRTDVEVELLKEQRAEDTRTIGKLRQAVEMFMAWGRHLQTHWDEIRAKPHAPVLPDINID